MTDNGYRDARERAAWRRRDDRRVIAVSGADRLAWLQGLLTNDVKALAGGGACYAAWLTPQGRMITDADVVELGHETWLDVSAPLAGRLVERLDSLVFAEDVHLAEAGAVVLLGVYGPEAGALVARHLGVEPPDRPYGFARLDAGEGIAALVGSDHLGVPGVHVYAPGPVAEALIGRLAGEGVPELDEGSAEVLRVEAGRPRFGADMGEDTIPLEAGIESRAISHTKGCYVGQEIIVRLRDLAHGRVARRLVGLLVNGSEAPSAGEPIVVEGRPVGRVTSAVGSIALGRPIALGYVHRDHAEAGTVVQVGPAVDATVTSLPFVPPQAVQRSLEDRTSS